MTKPLKIVFYGTPEFAVPSLALLLRNGYQAAAVVTSPDKPAGRGLKMSTSAVKKYASEKGLTILQPVKLSDESFIKSLKDINPDLQIVVAFRKMPEAVWNYPGLGTFNLHASLLPQYRGAAPINHAIINGETETGVSTFFLSHEIDTGKIIFREKTFIGESETAGELHDRLMEIGAELVLKTVRAIEKNNYSLTDQSNLFRGELKTAPKIFKNDCRIDWNNSAQKIFNLIRGLSPYPTAFTEIVSPQNEKYLLKIFKAEAGYNEKSATKGTIESDSKSFIKIKCADGWINLKEVQLEGRKKMKIEEFIRGFLDAGWWKAV